MDYPITLPSQLKQQIRSLRKARGLTQAELAVRLGVGQSRVADIEANPGAVSVEQLLQVLALLQAQVVVRDMQPRPADEAAAGDVMVAMKPGVAPAARQAPVPRTDADPPQGQW